MVDPGDPDGARDPAESGRGSRLAHSKPVTAVRRRYAGSIVQDVGRELSALDVANQATLLGAGLLASLLPLLILLSAFANRRVDDDIALRLGLNPRAEAIVGNLLHSSPATLNAATLVSLVVAAAGTIAVASALQQMYEKVFRLPHRGVRDLPRLLIWIMGLCGVVAFESLIGRPVRNAAGGSGLIELITGAIFILFFWWTMHFLLAGRVRWRVLLPSAITTGALFAVLGVFSKLYFSSTIITDSRTFGPVGAVFSLLTWLIAISLVIIVGALAGAVWQQRHSDARHHEQH